MSFYQVYFCNKGPGNYYIYLCCSLYNPKSITITVNFKFTGKTVLLQLLCRMRTETGLACGLNAETDDKPIMDDTAWTVPADGHSLLNKYTLRNHIYNSKLLTVLEAHIWIIPIKLHVVCSKCRKWEHTGRVVSSHPHLLYPKRQKGWRHNLQFFKRWYSSVCSVVSFV